MSSGIPIAKIGAVSPLQVENLRERCKIIVTIAAEETGLLAHHVEEETEG
jgi:hypothetical protein